VRLGGCECSNLPASADPSEGAKARDTSQSGKQDLIEGSVPNRQLGVCSAFLGCRLSDIAAAIGAPNNSGFELFLRARIRESG